MQHHMYLSVLFIRQDGQWVAQALEHDLAAQGASFELAKRAFKQTVCGQIVLDRKLGREPLTHLSPAPEEYWVAFEAAKERKVAKAPLCLEHLPPAYMIQAIASQPLADFPT